MGGDVKRPAVEAARVAEETEKRACAVRTWHARAASSVRPPLVASMVTLQLDRVVQWLLNVNTRDSGVGGEGRHVLYPLTEARAYSAHGLAVVAGVLDGTVCACACACVYMRMHACICACTCVQAGCMA